MMFRGLLRKRRLLSGAVSAILAASAYQAGGCTINVDENLLQQLQGLVEGMPGSGSHRGPYMGPPSGCGEYCHDGGPQSEPSDK